MIVVKVELWSANTGDKTELARMHISNDGTCANVNRGNYDGVVFRGRNTEALDKRVEHRVARLENFPRLQLHVWNMVARMLDRMGYQ